MKIPLLKSNLTLIAFISAIFLVGAQTTFVGNGNTGFGGPVGPSTMDFSDDGTTVSVTFTKGGGSFNDALVIYIDANVPGRSVIDGAVNDEGDALRRAISSAGTNASVITFPPGFEATHAIAIYPDNPSDPNNGFGGLWSIPATGQINNNDLNYITSVNSTLTTGGQASFTFDFDWAEIGLTGVATDNIDFVATYLNPNDSFLSNEGYGNGLPPSNPGGNSVTFTQYYRYQNNLSGNSNPLLGGIARTFDIGFWSTDSNWENGNQPLESDRVIIEDLFFLDINAAVEDLEVTSGGSLTVEPNATLFVDGTVNSNNTITIDGTLSAITADLIGDYTFGPTGILKVNPGSTTFVDNLYFESTNAGSGQIDRVEGTLTIQGDVTVERFIPVTSGTTVSNGSTRGYRFLASPVNTTNPIFDNWQESGSTTASFGTHITGPGGAANGFDPTQTNNPSMFIFDNTFTGANQANAWQTVPNTNNTNLEIGEGYRVFIRGNRNYNLNSSPPNPPNADVTLRATGTPIVGPVVENLSNVANYYSFVGNPYQAIVDMQLLNYTNVDSNSYYVWDPNVGQFGAYVAVDITNGSNTLGSDANQYLMPGQSFFVQTLANAPASIEFTETTKRVNEPRTAVFSDAIAQEAVNTSIKLYPENEYGSGALPHDGISLSFGNDFSDGIGEEDAIKMMNPGENISFQAGEKNLVINKTSYPVDGTIIDLESSNLTAESYVLEIDAALEEVALNAYLVDRHTGENLLLQDGLNTYSFVPTTEGVQKRFALEFTSGEPAADFVEVTLFPNPVSAGSSVSLISEDLQNKEASYEIYNLNGQLVKQGSDKVGMNGETTIETNSLSQGIYMLNISSGDISLSRKLIVR